MTRAARIVHVLGGAGVGGTERQLLLLLANLDPSRFRSEVILIRGGPLEDDFRRRAPTLVIDKRGQVDRRFLVQLVRALRAARPQIVHTWGSTANLWGSLAARLAGAPHVIVNERALEEWKGPALRAADRVTARWADRIVGNSAAVVAAAARRGALPSRMMVIHNGVEMPPANGPRGREKSLVVVLGRFDPRKGQDLLVEALPAVFGGVPGARAILAGAAVRPAEKEFEALVRARIDALGIGDRVELPGAVEDPRALLRKAAVAVTPSRSEGLPNAVLEAMAEGAPVVATNVGGISELVTDGVTGLLVPPEEPAELSRAVISVMMDGEAAAQRATNARRLVNRSFSPDALAKAWEEVYGAVLEEPVRSGGHWYLRRR